MSTVRKIDREAGRAQKRMAAEREREAAKVTIYVSNGTMTSDGPGPGVRRVPPDEAGNLVAAKLAVHGDRPPRGLYGDAADRGLS